MSAMEVYVLHDIYEEWEAIIKRSKVKDVWAGF